MSFHLQSPWGATVNTADRVCDKLERNKTVRVGKNSASIFSCLWTKVHDIVRQCMRPFVLSNALGRLSTLRFVQKIFAVKLRSGRKRLVFEPPIWGRGYPRFWTCVFKLHLLPTMWQFSLSRSASSESMWRKKERIQKERKKERKKNPGKT